MTGIRLTPDEVSELWRRQKSVIPGGRQRQTVGQAWIFLILLLLPLIVSGFSQSSVIACAIGGGLYLAYSIAAGLVLGTRRISKVNKDRRHRLAAVMWHGFGSLTLLFLSILLLWTALLTAGEQRLLGNPFHRLLLQGYLAIFVVWLALAPLSLKAELQPSGAFIKRVHTLAAGLHLVVFAGSLLLGRVLVSLLPNTKLGIGALFGLGAFLPVPFYLAMSYKALVLIRTSGDTP